MNIHQERRAMLEEQNRARYKDNESFTLDENGHSVTYIWFTSQKTYQQFKKPQQFRNNRHEESSPLNTSYMSERAPPNDYGPDPSATLQSWYNNQPQRKSDKLYIRIVNIPLLYCFQTLL